MRSESSESSAMSSSVAVWRKSMEITQRDLANLAKVSQGHVSAVESLRADLGPKLESFMKSAGEGALDAINQHPREMKQREKAMRNELLAAGACELAPECPGAEDCEGGREEHGNEAIS